MAPCTSAGLRRNAQFRLNKSEEWYHLAVAMVDELDLHGAADHIGASLGLTCQATVHERPFVEFNDHERNWGFRIETLVLRAVDGSEADNPAAAGDLRPFQVATVTMGTADTRIIDEAVTGFVPAALEHQLASIARFPEWTIDVG